MENLFEEIKSATRKTYKIKDVGRVVTGKTPSKDNPLDWGSLLDFITPTDISSDDKYITDLTRKLSEGGASRFSSQIIPAGSILVTCIGTVGKIVVNKNRALTNQQINSIVVNEMECDRDFIYYKIRSIVPTIKSVASGSTMPILNKSDFENLEITLPELPLQKKIAEVLNVYDEKIENNNSIIKNLEATAQAIFDEWFVKFRFPGHENVKMVESEMGEIPEGWRVEKVHELADVTIGRTPPRQEREWFSVNSADKKWISIKDLGSSNVFIDSTNEYLTAEAVQKFRVPLIPKGTVIVSFKLTIGRVAITAEDMYSNEAIAHIKTRTLPASYIYFYLKGFNYDSLGSTSSIATAVNSESIKQMSVLVPSSFIVQRFDNLVHPAFDQILTLKTESKNLRQTQSLLLAKLI